MARFIINDANNSNQIFGKGCNWFLSIQGHAHKYLRNPSMQLGIQGVNCRLSGHRRRVGTTQIYMNPISMNKRNTEATMTEHCLKAD